MLSSHSNAHGVALVPCYGSSRVEDLLLTDVGLKHETFE